MVARMFRRLLAAFATLVWTANCCQSISLEESSSHGAVKTMRPFNAMRVSSVPTASVGSTSALPVMLTAAMRSLMLITIRPDQPSMVARLAAARSASS